MQQSLFFSKLNFPLRIAAGLLSLILMLLSPSAVLLSHAATAEELEEAALARKALPIQTNEIADWPTGPEVSAQAAILMEAKTGTILYGKNIDEQLYPASTTKMLTCLIAAETCSLTDMVTISYTAVSSVPSDGSSIGADAGESMPLEECLYAILVASANEVASAVGEHVAGSIDAFTELMNQKAAELGCTNSHFSNCNGLFLEDHYTSAHDLALIAQAFFENDTLYRIGNTASHHFVATATQPDDFTITNKHKLINGEISYDGIIGGKTGYTGEARQTLVTGCEQNGMRLICVVLMEEAPSQFEDTVTLFDYGYQNFSLQSIAGSDTTYSMGSSNFFETGRDIFSRAGTILTLDAQDVVVLPSGVDFSELSSVLTFCEGEDYLADITYSFSGVPVGSAHLIEGLMQTGEEDDPVIDTVLEDQDDNASVSDHIMNAFQLTRRTDSVIFINVRKLLLWVALIASAMIALMCLYSMLHSRQDLRHERKRLRKLRRNMRASRRIDRRDRKRRTKLRSKF